MGDDRGRAWRDAFSALRCASPTATALEDLLLLHRKQLLASSSHLPPQEVAEDIIFLVRLTSSENGDIGDIKMMRDRICCLIMDVSSNTRLASIPAYIPKVLQFLEMVIEFSLNDMSTGLSKLSARKPSLDSLQALGQIVNDFGDKISSDDAVRLCAFLLKILKSGSKSRELEMQRLIFVGLTNLLSQSGSLIPSEIWLEILKAIKDILDSMSTGGQLIEDSRSSRFYSGVLRCLQLVLADIKSSVGEHVAGLVSSLVYFFGYGLGASRVPIYDAPSKNSGDAKVNEAPAKKSVYRPPHLRHSTDKAKASQSSENAKSEVVRRSFLSDSEQSDSDGSIGEGDRFKCSKARALAILCVQALARKDPKSLHAHWMLLFPAHDVLSNRRLQNSLLKSVLYDPILKVRMAAAATISLMLEAPSRAFMQMAEYRESGRYNSFMTLSISLGHVLLQLQRGLTFLVVNESNMGLLVANLKALSTFVGAAPFYRLPPQMLPDIISAVQKRLKNLISLSIDHTSASCMALNCLACTFNTVPPSKQVANLLSNSSSGSQAVNNQLVQDLLGCAESGMVTLIRVEALQALRFAVHNYPSTMVQYWVSMAPIRDRTLVCHPRNNGSDHVVDEKVVHAAVKLLNEFLRAESGSSFSEDAQDDMIVQSSFAVQLDYSPVNDPSESEIAEFNCWHQSLEEYLPALVLHRSPLVRAEAVTCFAGLTNVVFCSLPEKKKVFLISTTLEMASKDESPSVRSAACRAIGVIISFPSIVRRNEVLSSATDVVIHSTMDASIAVRITASWALANLCDALRVLSENGTEITATSLSLTALAESAMKLAKDSDKVRANAVRALGNLARFVKFNGDNAKDGDFTDIKSLQQSSETLRLLERVVQTLVSCVTTGNVKVQWNVCHALGNLFLNKSIDLPAMGWTSSVFSILLLLLRDSKNFKIRIQAALALAVPQSRNDYGESFYDVIKALLLAFDTFESNHDTPSTFKYLHALREQLTKTFLHLLRVALPEDYDYLQDFLLKRASYLENWIKTTYAAANLVEEHTENQRTAAAGSEDSCTSQPERCKIGNEKILPPPRERVWYALNDKDPFVCKEESSLKRKKDLKLVTKKLIDMYKHGDQTKVVVVFEQLLIQISSNG